MRVRGEQDLGHRRRGCIEYTRRGAKYDNIHGGVYDVYTHVYITIGGDVWCTPCKKRKKPKQLINLFAGETLTAVQEVNARTEKAVFPTG